MFDRVARLAYFKYFLGYPQLCLIRGRERKVAKNDLAACFIEGIFAGRIFVECIFAVAIFAADTFTRDTYKDVRLFDISS